MLSNYNKMVLRCQYEPLPNIRIKSSYPHYRMMDKGYKSKKHSKLIVRY